MSFDTVSERFALKRSNFVLDPEKDFGCFARKDIDVQGLRRAFALISLLTSHPSVCSSDLTAPANRIL